MKLKFYSVFSIVIRERGKQIRREESNELEKIETVDSDSKPIDGESDVDKER